MPISTWKDSASRAGWRRFKGNCSRLHGRLERFVDPRLPTRAGGAEMLDDLGVDTKCQPGSRMSRRRPAGSTRDRSGRGRYHTPAFSMLGVIEHLLRPFRRVIRIDPGGLRTFSLRAHDSASSKSRAGPHLDQRQRLPAKTPSASTKSSCRSATLLSRFAGSNVILIDNLCSDDNSCLQRSNLETGWQDAPHTVLSIPPSTP